MVYYGLEDEEYDRKYKDPALLRRIFQYLHPYRKHMGIVIFFSFISSLTTGIIPLLTRNLLNDLESNQDISAFIGLILLLLILNFASWGFNYMQQLYSAHVIGNVMLDLRNNAHAITIAQDLSFFDKNPVGRITSRINSDTESFGEMASIVMQTWSSLLLVILITIMMFFINLELTFVFMCFIPLIFAITLSIRKKARQQTLLGQKALSSVNTFVQENISGIHIAKAFHQETRILTNFLKVNDQSYRVNLKRAIVLNILFPAMFAAQGLIFAAIVYFGGRSIFNGTLTPGDLYFYLSSLWSLIFPIFSIAAFWPQFQSGLSAAERIFSLMDVKSNVIQCGSLDGQIIQGEVEFNHLKFSYASDKPVFSDLSFRISPGESIAIVGHTGAGKSSIAKLIGRYYEFQSGEIKIDGHSICEYDLPNLRRQMGFIPQVPFLWADTIENNIKYGKPDATREEVLNALESAGGSDWLQDLPNGIETNVEERGSLLSLGQRQLVALARILLEDPRILILDEATASVDPFTETRIQDALDRVMKNRTTIIIAHRLWTVRHVHRIFVLDQGKILEVGSHDELMQKKGYYASLYNTYFRHQSYEYIEKSKNS